MAKKLTDDEKAKAADLRGKLLTRKQALDEAKRSNPSAVPAWGKRRSSNQTGA